MNDRNLRILTLAALFLVMVGLAALALFWQVPASPEPASSVEPVSEQTSIPAAEAAGFAVFTAVPVRIAPQVPAYNVAAGLSNLANQADFSFTSEEAALLAKNAFVVRPGYQAEFFQLYEGNRYGYTPSFITTDSVLHNYHLMFDHLLKRLEENQLDSQLKALTASMLDASQKQYRELRGGAWENAAQRNVAFFAVGAKLLDPNSQLPDDVKDVAQRELDLIASHDRIEESAVINLGSSSSEKVISPAGTLGLEAFKEDYSQYVPRGHYDSSDQLRNYFRAMMWYGRLTFRLKNDDEMRSALLITQALGETKNRDNWNKIYEPTNFFVGQSDDLTYYQFRGLLEQIYGDRPTIAKIATDTVAFNAFVETAKKLDPPQINSVPVFNAQIQPDREQEIKGFRFMGQRFTVDAAIFQRLTDRETAGRMLPKSLDIPAAFGSNEALSILADLGEPAAYPDYSPNMAKLRTYTADLPVSTWTQNLYWGWMYSLRPLLGAAGQGYPSFMTNQAWARKNLNTFLGSWTELKHDTILYAKQAYAEMGGGPIDAKDDRGYVEPSVEVYARLASLLKMTNEGLDIRGLLSSDMKDNLNKMESLVLSLKEIAEKELANEKLSDADYELIRTYGGQLEHFWLEVNKEEMAKTQTNTLNYLNDNPAALIADVATDPNGSVLEEATGRIFEIYVAVPIDGQLRIAKGGVYSYYEFLWPLSDRLTDAKWREMLNSGQEPALPAWTEQFMIAPER